MECLVVKQTVGKCIPEIRANGTTEKRSNLEAQTLTEYPFSFWKINNSAEAILSLNPVRVQIRSLRSRLLKVEARHMLNLGGKDMKSRDKVALIAREQCFAEEEFSPWRYNWGLFGEIDEISSSQAVF